MAQEPPPTTSSNSSQSLHTEGIFLGSCLKGCPYHTPLLQRNTMTLVYKVGDHPKDQFFSEVTFGFSFQFSVWKQKLMYIWGMLLF